MVSCSLIGNFAALLMKICDSLILCISQYCQSNTVPYPLLFFIGEATPVAQASIELGIALLLGGNVSVQGRMLEYLSKKQLSGFFTSLAGLMQNCSVLDLDTFER